MSDHGLDATEAFERGAREALRIVEVTRATAAVLKARSPSCGRHRIYDGSFSGRLVEGQGVFAEYLLERGFDVRTEEDLIATQAIRAARAPE